MNTEIPKEGFGVVHKTIANRITEARNSLRLSQEEAARLLNVARVRLHEWETGKRILTMPQLEEFSEIYHKDISFFLREQKEESAFSVLLRTSHVDSDTVKEIGKFETYCHHFQKLFQLLKIESVENSFHKMYQSDFPVDPSRRLWEWGETYSEEQRNILGLGIAPIPNLRDILEDKLDIKIFYLSLDANVSGIFTYSSKLGGCILINATHTPGRQLFSLAHEFAHFLFHKSKLGLISSEQNCESPDEKLANSFAQSFLMPYQAVKNSFFERIGDRQNISAEDILYIADVYGVSFLAMVIRLNRLKLIPTATAERLKKETRVTQLREIMDLPEQPLASSVFPKSYMHLVIKAYRNRILTSSALAEFLDTDILSAKELAKKIESMTSNDPPS